MKKIVFISGHDYIAKRQGGFHVFAEKLSNFYDLTFFTYPRSFFIKIRRNSPIEYNNISYRGDRDIRCGKVRNVSRLFWIPPVSLLRYLPQFVVEWFYRLSFPSFAEFCDKYFDGVDFFMLESDSSVILFNYLKKKYPDAKFLYRPSDPMLMSSNLNFFHKYEKDYIRRCDFIFPVNQDGVDLYKEKINDFPDDRYEIVSNGIEIEAYGKKYPRPLEYGDLKNIASYIGARPAEWDLIVYSAAKLPEVNFFIICPENPTEKFKAALLKFDNIHYIQGISPSQVPQFVTNADMIIVPNPTCMYKSFPWGVTAKYYQAMYSKKPIVSYHDNEKVEQLGIPVAFTYDEFAEMVNENIKKGETSYNIDLVSKDWNKLAQKIITIIESL